ncbi:MAG: acylphosphatase, partial [Desulfurococcaceae archaeon]
MRFSGETLSLRIVVSGIVQGVGFRPFIYRLAKELGLKGYVVNLGGSSVEIRLEGSRESIREFILRLDRDKPPKALIKEIVIEEEEIEGFDSFEIKDSVNIVIQRSMIPPDIS